MSDNFLESTKVKIIVVVVVLFAATFMMKKENNNILNRTDYAVGVTVEDYIVKGRTRKIYYKFNYKGEIYSTYSADFIWNGVKEIIVPNGIYLVVLDSLEPERNEMIFDHSFLSLPQGDSIVSQKDYKPKFEL